MTIIRLVLVFILLSLSLLNYSCKKEMSEEILITTGDHTTPTVNSVTLNGTIVDPGKGIADYGHCWSKIGTPVFSDNPSTLGARNTPGDFHSDAKDLEANTTYYYRAYAYDGNKPVYGSTESFTTADYGATVVTTCHIDTLDINSYKATASITDLGAGVDSLSSYGFCWSDINTIPSKSDSFCNLGVLKAPLNNFAHILTELKNNKKYYIRAYAVSRKGINYSSETISFTTLPALNHAPVFVSIPDPYAYEDSPYIYDVTAEDQDGDALVYSAIQIPSWLSFNPSTHSLYGVPAQSDVKTHTVKLRVSDGKDQTDQTFTITVINVNDAPVITSSAPGNAYIDKTFSYQVTATDADGDPLTYSLIEYPLGFTMNASGLITAYPGYDLKGNHPLTVRVSDNHDTQDERTYTLTIKPETSSITDLRDQKVYTTVRIGSHWWMAQNLNVGTRISSSNIQTDNGILEKYCYNNNESSCNTYGGLYQWDEVMQYQSSDNSNPGITLGVCPSGWHIPTDNEWKELDMFLGMSASDASDHVNWIYCEIGRQLKEALNTHWEYHINAGASEPNANMTDFTALPAGRRVYDSSFEGIGTQAFIWTSTESSATETYVTILVSHEPGIGRQAYFKTNGFSVRCIKN
jgi:uncharacterized protein (TIGR02145 family)